MTTAVLNTKNSEVENKIHDHANYITIQEFNKITAENFAARLTEANLVSKTDFDNKQISFNRKITWNKTTYLKDLKRLNSLITKFYTFTITYFTSHDGSQNTLVYQPTLDILELKKDKCTDYGLSWKWKGVYNSKLESLYTAFLHNTKLSGHGMAIKFDKDHLAVERNNYLSKIVKFYIVYDLYVLLRNPTNNFKFKNYLFEATNIV